MNSDKPKTCGGCRQFMDMTDVPNEKSWCGHPMMSNMSMHSGHSHHIPENGKDTPGCNFGSLKKEEK
jgi:hypothetical protein